VRQVPGVIGVHDLHVWSLTTGVNSMSLHVVRDESASHEQVLCDVREQVHEGFKIEHVTIQVETARCEEAHA
jgi:cobalt-zinc-cadmium efflux system protein